MKKNSSKQIFRYLFIITVGFVVFGVYGNNEEKNKVSLVTSGNHVVGQTFVPKLKTSSSVIDKEVDDKENNTGESIESQSSASSSINSKDEGKVSVNLTGVVGLIQNVPNNKYTRAQYHFYMFFLKEALCFMGGILIYDPTYAQVCKGIQGGDKFASGLESFCGNPVGKVIIGALSGLIGVSGIFDIFGLSHELFSKEPRPYNQYR